jgi:hypothetical protein
MLGPDPADNGGRNRSPAAWAYPGLLPGSSRSASFRNQAPQLVDRDESCAPRHLYGFNQWQDAPIEGGAADAERFRRLRARVGQPLDARRLAHDQRRRYGSPSRRRVPPRLLGLATKPAV